jgi:hypothetical protein
LRNEQGVLETLLSLVEACLSAYPTTFEEDNGLLKDPSIKPFSNRRHAIIQVRPPPR